MEVNPVHIRVWHLIPTTSCCPPRTLSSVDFSLVVQREPPSFKLAVPTTTHNTFCLFCLTSRTNALLMSIFLEVKKCTYSLWSDHRLQVSVRKAHMWWYSHTRVSLQRWWLIWWNWKNKSPAIAVPPYHPQAGIAEEVYNSDRLYMYVLHLNPLALQLQE